MAGSAGSTDSGVRLRQAIIELSSVAAIVDRLCDASHPSMELLDASRSVHNALVFLDEFGGSPGDHSPGARPLVCT